MYRISDVRPYFKISIDQLDKGRGNPDKKTKPGVKDTGLLAANLSMPPFFRKCTVDKFALSPKNHILCRLF